MLMKQFTHLSLWLVLFCSCQHEHDSSTAPKDAGEMGEVIPDSESNPESGENEDSPDSGVQTEESPDSTTENEPDNDITYDKQRPGDAEAGYDYLINGDYLGCGIPKGAYTISQRGQSVSENLKLPGRNDLNADLIYEVNAFETDTGVEVVAPNCLSCHATTIRGDVTIGLGNPNRDFSVSPALPLEALRFVVFGADNKAAFDRYKERTQIIADTSTTPVIGANPADAVAALLFTHHDPKTLAWSDAPLIDPPTDVIPSDVPPLWNVKKKETLYYAGVGAGHHNRMMMIASMMCVDDVTKAAEIADKFVDVEAYLETLEAPPYPQDINSELSAQGQAIFENKCATCHGTYGENETYPNRVIPLDEIGTDPDLATSDAFFRSIYRQWYNQSFYGKISHFEDVEGYIAPPLDGIWATAPYLHNGSVPTLEGVLDSSKRPTYYRRSDNSYDYDPSLPGYPYEELTEGHAAISNPLDRKHVYDTTLKGFSNSGHTFADDLTADERQALIEYLKTL